MRRLAAAASLLLLWLSLLFSLLYISGTSAPLMRRMMLRFAPPASTGLEAGDYAGLADTITAYLAGSADGMQHLLPDGSAMFTQRELAHMADCRALFHLDAVCLMISLAAGLLLLIPLRRLPPQDRRKLIRRVCIGLLTALGGIGLWAAADFNSLFLLFHRLSFNNELWLMRSTDWLIRLMPISFFMAYAAGITLLALLPPVLMLLLSRKGKP